MKNILYLLFLVTFISKAQTIEKKYSDFELIVNAKKVSEYVLKIPNEKFIGFDIVEEMALDLSTKSIKNEEYSFNTNGFIIEKINYYTDPKIVNQAIYEYDKNNLLVEIVEKESDMDTINYYDYSKIKITRNENEVTKTWTYAKKDTIYSEKFILENNYIIEEKAPYTNNIREKIIYDKKYNRIKGIITLVTGEQLIWTNTFTFYPNGTVKTKKNIWTDLKTKTTKTYLPNGLLKSDIAKNEILDYDYKYDTKGNWIYKIIYKNKKPSRFLKREIVYN